MSFTEKRGSYIYAYGEPHGALPGRWVPDDVEVGQGHVDPRYYDGNKHRRLCTYALDTLQNVLVRNGPTYMLVDDKVLPYQYARFAHAEYTPNAVYFHLTGFTLAVDRDRTPPQSVVLHLRRLHTEWGGRWGYGYWYYKMRLTEVDLAEEAVEAAMEEFINELMEITG